MNKLCSQPISSWRQELVWAISPQRALSRLHWPTLLLYRVISGPLLTHWLHFHGILEHFAKTYVSPHSSKQRRGSQHFKSSEVLEVRVHPVGEYGGLNKSTEILANPRWATPQCPWSWEKRSPRQWLQIWGRWPTPVPCPRVQDAQREVSSVPQGKATKLWELNDMPGTEWGAIHTLDFILLKNTVSLSWSFYRRERWSSEKWGTDLSHTANKW